MHTNISTIAYEGKATSIGSTITQTRTGVSSANDHYSFPTLPYLEGFYLDSNGTGSRLDISTTSSLVSYNITTSSTRGGSSPSYTYTWNVVFTSVTFADNLESEILAVKRPDGSDLKPDTKLVYTGSLTSYASNTTSYAMYSFVPRVHDTVYAVWRWSTTYPSTTTITSHSASIQVQKDNYPGWNTTPLNQYV
jgi:hypothetical protein